MSPRVRTLLAIVIAALVAAPAAASARTTTRTYSGTVIAPAVADSAGHVTLPLLLSPRAELVLRRPVIAPLVPAGAKPVKWGTGHLALAELRPGDSVTVQLSGTRAKAITLQRSGSADDFDRILRQLHALGDAVAKTTQLATPVAAAAGGSYPRDQLRTLRDQVTDLQGDLDSIDSDVQTSLTRLASVRPTEQHRHDAVAAAQAAYEQQLTAVRDAAVAARDQSELAAEGLDAVAYIPGSNDGTQTPVDPALPIVLPIGTVSTVSSLLGTLTVLSNNIGLVNGLLVG